ncbi:YslB family protein [Aquibacillus rhizosphaerae]|uniref:YslB family protein n=1 Tax=Aquibacillus rhizosphaerae TaxID=3051431 RepID=A0ABT7L421_9BACI|nr:YslB family protein [Aquibacillus sp. LR5S19]MDL4840615.1 YslB family protein [Aquibacillus sp. LR5S19]
MHKNLDNIELIVNELHTSGAGYDLIRYVCLPDLLGKDANTILYVLGKNLARKLELKTVEDIIDFFHKTGWGDLNQIKEKRREYIFELTGDVIKNRSESGILDEYRIESGFLAEAMQQIKSAQCECVEEIKKKKHTVEFHVMYSR